MSLCTYYMRQASKISALHASRGLKIEETLALRVAPVSFSIILHALRLNSASPFAGSGLRYALNRSHEDVLNNPKRLGAADVRARGDALFQKIMGRHADRAVATIAQLAMTDKHSARTLMAMSTAAVACVLSETKRELRLNGSQTLGVLISEAAFMDSVDPALLVTLRERIFRPALWSRAGSKLSSLLRRRQQIAPA